MPLIHFLIVFDHGQQRLISADEFSDATEAANAYAELERLHRGNENLEIVLVGADSLDTIRQTHGNYFDGEEPAPHRDLAGATS